MVVARDDVSRSKPCSQAGMLAQKTSRSEAFRGGLIESHTILSVARMPVTTKDTKDTKDTPGRSSLCSSCPLWWLGLFESL
jgi:hypothetical protein